MTGGLLHCNVNRPLITYRVCRCKTCGQPKNASRKLWDCPPGRVPPGPPGPRPAARPPQLPFPFFLTSPILGTLSAFAFCAPFVDLSPPSYSPFFFSLLICLTSLLLDAPTCSLEDSSPRFQRALFHPVWWSGASTPICQVLEPRTSVAGRFLACARRVPLLRKH